MKFYPYNKRGTEKVLATLKEGHKTFWGSFYAVAILKGGGHITFPLFKRGCGNSFTLS